jgi:DNA-binding transcriptional LysR family regulator
MNTFQLDCFLAVADHLSFAKAAEQLNISQPAVTHQIRSLENELNVQLFRRTTRTVELTVEGHTFLSDARNIVRLSNRAIKRFEQNDEQKIVDFSIGCTTQAQFDLLPNVIEKLVELYPYLHPRIVEIPSTQIMRQLNEETIDVAIALKMDLKNTSLIYQELKKIPVICVCRDDHPFVDTDCVTLEEVKQNRLILYHPASVSREIIQLQNRLSESKKLSELYFCESEEAALTLVRAGLGIAILPDIFTEKDLHKNSIYHLKKSRLADVGDYSFGFYYKTLSGHNVLKDFLRLCFEA